MSFFTYDIPMLWSTLGNQAHDLAPKVLTSLVLFLTFYLLSLIIKYGTLHTFRKLNNPHGILRLLSKTAQTIIILIGLVTALGTAGINVSALVASLGLVGFAVGFALKDFIANMLAGMLILFYHPFRIGDNISGKDFTGKVLEVNLRYTLLLNEDKHILIPNATLLNNTITLERHLEKSATRT